MCSFITLVDLHQVPALPRPACPPRAILRCPCGWRQKRSRSTRQQLSALQGGRRGPSRTSSHHMDAPVRQPTLGYRPPAAPSAAPTSLVAPPPSQPAPLRAPGAQSALAMAPTADDDDDMPPLLPTKSGDDAAGTFAAPPARTASAGASSPAPSSGALGQPRYSSGGASSPPPSSPPSGHAHGGGGGDGGHGHSHGGSGAHDDGDDSHGHSHGSGGGLLASLLGVVGLGDAVAAKKGHGHGHGGEQSHEGESEHREGWDGRYKYEVAQTLAARMRGAQVKPELADLHMTVDAWTAVQSGSVEHLDVALSASLSFDLDALDKKGFSLLHYAAKRPNLALVRMLVSRGANINRNAVSDAKERPLQSAVEGGDLAVVDFLVLQGADVHNVNYKGQSALHVAVMMNRMLIVELLIRRGVNVDAADVDGTTPLHWAAFNGVGRAVEVLLSYGANFLAKDAKGLIPLHWGAAKGHAQIIDKITDNIRNHPTLTEEDCHKSVHARDLSGNTPLFYAKKSGNDKAVTFMNYLITEEYSNSPISKRYRFLSFSAGTFLSLAGMCALFAYTPGWFFTLVFLISMFVVGVPRRALALHQDGHPVFPGIWVSTIFLGHVIILTRLAWDVVNAPYGTLALFLDIFFAGIYTRNFLKLVWMRNPGFTQRTAADLLEVFEAIQSPDPGIARQYCTTCLNRKPLRSKHCSDCGRCVQRFDHQCLWTNKCVGLNNHREFFVFVHFLWMDCIVYGWILYTYCSILSGQSDLRGIAGYAWEKEGFALMYFVWIVLNNIWIFILGVYQAKLISKNLTTNEKVNWKRYRYLQDDNGHFRNPYDKGFVHNWREFYRGQVPNIGELRTTFQQQV